MTPETIEQIKKQARQELAQKAGIANRDKQPKEFYSNISKEGIKGRKRDKRGRLLPKKI